MFSTCKSVNYDDFNKRSFLMEQSVQISSNTFWGTPFLEKGPPKITEGGPFDPHWLISKINPAYRIQLCTKNIQSNCCTVKKDVFLWWWWWSIWHLVPLESCWFQTTVEPPLMSNSPQWPLLYSGYIPNRDLQSCHTDQNFPFIPKSQKFLSQSVTILVKSFNYITSHYDVQASS